MCATEELVCVCVHNSVYIGLYWLQMTREWRTLH